MRLVCRAWFEWIDSDSNISDGLSREGVTDPWTKAQGWDLKEIKGTKSLAYSCKSLNEWLWMVA